MGGSRQSSKNASADFQLKQFFRRNGYVRLPNSERREQLGSQKYKKGYEVRLVAKMPGELRHIRSLLRQAGFKAGNAFFKGKQIIQPIYGKAAVEWFLAAKLN